MRIWGISDTHFSGDHANTMAFWSEVWIHHQESIVRNWRALVDEQDLVMIGGDISWAYRFPDVLQDLRLLDRLPGRVKLLVKGNHDRWWERLEEVRRLLPERMIALGGDAVNIEGQVFCGTTGWLAPNDPGFDNLDHTTFEREMGLLENALEAAVNMTPRQNLHLLLHFPPFTTNGVATPFLDLILQYPVDTCTFGHFHLPEEWHSIPSGLIRRTSFQLTASDYLNHQPALIWQEGPPIEKKR